MKGSEPLWRLRGRLGQDQPCLFPQRPRGKRKAQHGRSGTFDDSHTPQTLTGPAPHGVAEGDSHLSLPCRACLPVGEAQVDTHTEQVGPRHVAVISDAALCPFPLLLCLAASKPFWLHLQNISCLPRHSPGVRASSSTAWTSADTPLWFPSLHACLLPAQPLESFEQCGTHHTFPSPETSGSPRCILKEVKALPRSRPWFPPSGGFLSPETWSPHSAPAHGSRLLPRHTGRLCSQVVFHPVSPEGHGVQLTGSDATSSERGSESLFTRQGKSGHLPLLCLRFLHCSFSPLDILHLHFSPVCCLPTPGSPLRSRGLSALLPVVCPTPRVLPYAQQGLCGC